MPNVYYNSKNVREILEMRRLVLVFMNTEKLEEWNTEKLTIKIHK